MKKIFFIIVMLINCVICEAQFVTYEAPTYSESSSVSFTTYTPHYVRKPAAEEYTIVWGWYVKGDHFAKTKLKVVKLNTSVKVAYAYNKEFNSWEPVQILASKLIDAEFEYKAGKYYFDL